MPVGLTKIFIKTDSDILRLHQLALQIARWAGLPVAEQICFAVNVSNNSFQVDNADEQITFSIAQRSNQSFLTAYFQNKDYTIEKVLPAQIGTSTMAVFLENIDMVEMEWRKYRDMQQFIFALSHDLKNSLTKLKLALSLTAAENTPPPIDDYIQIIGRSATHLESMLLSLNRILEVGDASPDVVKNISPGCVFEMVKQEFLDTIEDNKAIIDADFSNTGQISYIEVYLKSIFSNLLGNALKYAVPGRPLYVAVHSAKLQDQVLLTFADNGQGIDLAKNGDKLFQPFTRFSDKKDGSGVGLYLVKTIVERNGGRIQVESKPEEGTTFYLTLREYKLPDTFTGT